LFRAFSLSSGAVPFPGYLSGTRYLSGHGELIDTRGEDAFFGFLGRPLLLTCTPALRLFGELCASSFFPFPSRTVIGPHAGVLPCTSRIVPFTMANDAFALHHPPITCAASLSRSPLLHLESWVFGATLFLSVSCQVYTTKRLLVSPPFPLVIVASSTQYHPLPLPIHPQNRSFLFLNYSDRETPTPPDSLPHSPRRALRRLLPPLFRDLRLSCVE